jgi:hypothetical protein
MTAINSGQTRWINIVAFALSGAMGVPLGELSRITFSNSNRLIGKEEA